MIKKILFPSLYLVMLLTVVECKNDDPVTEEVPQTTVIPDNNIVEADSFYLEKDTVFFQRWDKYESVTVFPGKGGPHDYNFADSMTIKSSEEWCKISTGFNDIEINVPENLKAGDRQAIITVKYKEQKETIVVIQRGVTPVEGANPHLFSIDGPYEHIRFSKGNLQYNASTDTWRFSENQYDVIGKGNENASSTYTGWIDLFGFGTSGYNEKYPWLTSTSVADYAPKVENSYYNWGIYNKINGGENKTGVWDVLTADEWRCIVSKSNRRATAIINGVEGLILLPDDFEKAPEGIILLRDGYNIYDVSEWLKLEELGAVFLPCAGVREGSTYNTQGGFYWASTHQSKTYGSYDGQNLCLSPSKKMLDNADIFMGGSVRLITRIK